MGQTVAKGARICVIGAGPCGLTAVKNMLAAGLDDVVCYDESGSIGGNWAFDESPRRASVYASTHIISSKGMSAFEDFPMPCDYPDFPSHQQLRAYFEAYAGHFGVLPSIRLKHRVDRARLQLDGRWSVSVNGPTGTTEEVFDQLIVCSGHHREPHVPTYPGAFAGEALHSAQYKRADRFSGKRVLVVGAGNSACDIAVDAARVAERTCLSVRRGTYIVPKLVCGRPIDIGYARLREEWHMPRPLVQPILGALVRLLVGPWEKYGLPRPQGRPLESHPTLNSAILSALRHGTVRARAGIDHFDGEMVHFRDGSADPFDVVIWCTGFRISFPFLDASVLDQDFSRPPPLYLKMSHRRIDNLFFIGLFQPIGCIWRLADLQARIAALQISGRLQRHADIAARIDREIRSPHWRFLPAARHAIEVDYHDFRRELRRELAHAHPQTG